MRRTTQASAILEVSILAPIIEFFLQLVAMEWVPGGVHNKSKKVDKGGCMQSDMIERGNQLCAVFG